MTTTEPATPNRGGRPRDPSVDGRVIDALITILAENGMPGVHADLIAATAGVGKATVYRRWRTMPDLLRDTVATLGVRPGDVDYGPIEGGTLRGDITAVITAAVVGRRADAEMAVMSHVMHTPDLKRAYQAGPWRRLEDAFGVVAGRAIGRGDSPHWPGTMALRAVVSFLQVRAMTHQRPWTTQQDIRGAIDLVLGGGWDR